MIELSVKKPTNNGDCLYSKEVLSLSLPHLKIAEFAALSLSMVIQYTKSRGEKCVFSD